MTLLLASFTSTVLGLLMFTLSIFLILLVLVQRGKGGGLTGALGGPGGQSAFGSKAGDTFTMITAVSAIIWGLVCAIAMYTLGDKPMTAAEAESMSVETPAAIVSPGDEQNSSAAGGLSGLSELLSEDSESTDGESTESESTDSDAPDSDSSEEDSSQPESEDGTEKSEASADDQ